jgi:hypothetical protein
MSAFGSLPTLAARIELAKAFAIVTPYIQAVVSPGQFNLIAEIVTSVTAAPVVAPVVAPAAAPVAAPVVVPAPTPAAAQVVVPVGLSLAEQEFYRKAIEVLQKDLNTPVHLHERSALVVCKALVLSVQEITNLGRAPSVDEVKMHKLRLTKAINGVLPFNPASTPAINSIKQALAGLIGAALHTTIQGDCVVWHQKPKPKPKSKLSDSPSERAGDEATTPATGSVDDVMIEGRLGGDGAAQGGPSSK